MHTLDAARLYRLALEAAPAGTRLHAVADEGVPFRRDRRGHRARPGVPVASIPPDEPATLRLPRRLRRVDNPASSLVTQKVLDWEPAHPGLIEDLDEGHYFEA